MKRIIISVVSILTVFLLMVSAAAKTIMIDGDWSYEATKDASAWMIDNYIGSSQDVVVSPYYASKPIISASEHAFMNNVDILRIDIGDVLSEIGDYCFTGCSSLSSVKLSSSVTSIGIGAFSNTSSLSEINLEETMIENVAAYCYAGSGISAIILPITCTTIGNCAFQNCSALTSVTIPVSVNEIADTAFSGCEKLVIHAPYGSYAITYAIAHGIDYVYSDLEAYTFKRGDADLDNAITIMDATRIQRYLVHFENTNPDGRIDLRAAFGSDGKISILDATRIQRYIAKFNDPYGIGEEVTVYLLPDGTVFDPTNEDA